MGRGWARAKSLLRGEGLERENQEYPFRVNSKEGESREKRGRKVIAKP